MDIFKEIDGLRHLNEDELIAVREFEREMTEETIPAIIESLEIRYALAQDAKRREVESILERARQEVKPLVDREREGEHIPQGLMEFRMR